MKTINIHPKNPQKNLIKKVVEILSQGGIIAYPTESGYALGCALDNKDGFSRICSIRNISKNHHFTLMLNELAGISSYINLNNNNFRLLKRVLPGAYTFILPATKSVPNRLVNKKRKTIGIRISQYPIVQDILKLINEPIMSVSLRLDIEMYTLSDIVDNIGKQVDLIVGVDYCPTEPTTVIDLIDKPKLIRQGLASSDFL